jgi:hypothetical protein
MRWKGAMVLALVDKLEAAGIRVQLDVMLICSAIGRNDTWHISVAAKGANERLQIDSLAFLLAHPSSFRRVMFSYMETHAEALRFGAGGFGGYGYPSDYKPEGYDLFVPQLSYLNVKESVEAVERLFKQVCNVEPDLHKKGLN